VTFGNSHSHEDSGVVKPALLLEVVRQARPGAQVDATRSGKYVVVGFHCAGEDVWIPLEHDAGTDLPERLLAKVANMLTCCLHPPESCSATCHHEHRLMANRLKQFLGDAGFRRFLENAPIATGRATTSG
jgi:hypothetical protein